MKTTQPVLCATSSAHISPSKSRPNTEDGTLERWNDDIVQASRACARKRGLQADHPFADDVAQEVRLALVLAIRKTGIKDERYLRRVISNSAKNSTRQTLVVTREVSDDSIEELPQEQPAVRDVLAERRTREWLHDLPRQLKAVFHLLYRRGLSQREAAVCLGVSQPRVAKLHRQLLRCGADGLRDLAA